MLPVDCREMLKMKKVLLRECWIVAGQQRPEGYCEERGGLFFWLYG